MCHPPAYKSLAVYITSANPGVLHMHKHHCSISSPRFFKANTLFSSRRSASSFDSQNRIVCTLRLIVTHMSLRIRTDDRRAFELQLYIRTSIKRATGGAAYVRNLCPYQRGAGRVSLHRGGGYLLHRQQIHEHGKFKEKRALATARCWRCDALTRGGFQL